MDPAALGTLLIGLDAVRAEQSDERRARRKRRTAQATQRPASRVVVAAALRALADRLDRPTPVRVGG